MSQKSQHVLFTAFQVILHQALDAKTIHELLEKMETLTAFMYVFTEESERKTLITNHQMKRLWDLYMERLKSEYLEIFYPKKTELEIAEMSEQEIAEMYATQKFKKFKLETQTTEIYENRQWDPWLLGQFFNPMFWIRDNRNFFSPSDGRDFNQYMENAFKTLAETYSDWKKIVSESVPYDDEFEEWYTEYFRRRDDAYAYVVYHFSNLIYQDFEVMYNCRITDNCRITEYVYTNNCSDTLTEASIEYINTKSDETTRYLWEITDIYEQEKNRDGSGDKELIDVYQRTEVTQRIQYVFTNM